MGKIRRVSKILKWVVLVFLVGLVVLDVGFWVLADPSDEFYRDIFEDELLIDPMVPVSGSVLSLGLAFLASLPGTALYATSLFFLARLFSLYSQGIIFSAANVQCMKRSGWFLLFGQLSTIITSPLVCMALTMDNPEGERLLIISLEDTELTAILAAVAVILVSWVMDEARKLQDEQALVV